MARQRPAKMTRLLQKRESIIKANSETTKTVQVRKVVDSNGVVTGETRRLESLKGVSPAKFDTSYRQAGSSKDRLRLGSYGVGFQGPRGFNSPKDHVPKRELDGQAMAPKSQGPTFGASASQRFREDDFRTEKPDNRVQVKPKGAKRWRSLGT